MEEPGEAAYACVAKAISQVKSKSVNVPFRGDIVVTFSSFSRLKKFINATIMSQ